MTLNTKPRDYVLTITILPSGKVYLSWHATMADALVQYGPFASIHNALDFYNNLPVMDADK